jgi:hypothetical protein
MRKLQKQSVDTWVRWAAERNLSLTRAEVKEMVDKYNDTISQSVPFSGGARLKPNNIKPNHAVGEVYKPNIHDPHEMYRWQDEEASAPAWVWAMRVLGTLGFFVGIYMLTLLTFLF